MSDPYHIPGGEVCKICGLTFYSRSFGGPNVCPSCDCGNFGQAAIQRQRDVISALELKLKDEQGARMHCGSFGNIVKHCERPR